MHQVPGNIWVPPPLENTFHQNALTTPAVGTYNHIRSITTMQPCLIENKAWFTAECETLFNRRFSESNHQFWALKHVYAIGLHETGSRKL